MRRFLAAVFPLLLLCHAPLAAQVAPPEVIAQAKKEGRVTWYTTVSIPESKQLIDIFEKQYPFIKVDLLRSGSGALVNRVLSEYAARTPVRSPPVTRGSSTLGMGSLAHRPSQPSSA